jgi:hypothetical protein
MAVTLTAAVASPAEAAEAAAGKAKPATAIIRTQIDMDQIRRILIPLQ